MHTQYSWCILPQATYLWMWVVQWHSHNQSWLCITLMEEWQNDEETWELEIVRHQLADWHWHYHEFTFLNYGYGELTTLTGILFDLKVLEGAYITSHMIQWKIVTENSLSFLISQRIIHQHTTTPQPYTLPKSMHINHINHINHTTHITHINTNIKYYR